MGGICSSQKHQTRDDESIATGVYDFLPKGAIEDVDSAKNDSSLPVMISNPKLFDCDICFQPLSIPISQCDNGHVVCSTCGPKLMNKCRRCPTRISSEYCKVIEKFLLSVEISCPNAKHGCKEKISYIGKRNHEEECIYARCYCPISGCDFVASSKVLSNHFRHKHEDSKIKFSYGHSFIVSLNSNDETFVLQEKNDGKKFILNNSTTVGGNAVNICCIGPNSSESEYSYDILAKSQICTLKLQSFAKNVQQFTSTTLSSEFLVIPFGSSEPRKIEICITPMIQIYIQHSTGGITPLRVKSSDTVINVKKMILDKYDIYLHHQRLIFEGKQLEDNLVLDNYNIQDKSRIHLVLRLVGS